MYREIESESERESDRDADADAGDILDYYIGKENKCARTSRRV